MRFFVSALMCAGLLLVVAGCDPATNKVYFREGIGSSLYTEDVVAQTALQNIYVEHICTQAGLTFSKTGETCGNDPYYDPKTWWLFVQAGMNDIDQRCDGYLTWLDNVRRAEAPTLKQFSDTHSATALIMEAAGVTSAAPMAIVAAAFGLASNTFSNVTSRLILEVNHSTVQSVVLSHQRQFREQLVGSAAKKPEVMIPNKPAAIYALRSYLRLCMPMTIETEINDTVATFARGGADALKSGEPMISAKSVGVAIKSTQPPPPPPPVKKGVINAVGQFEPVISLAQGKAFQRSLCVQPTGDFGPAGLPVAQASPTRAQLRQFNAAFRYGVDVPPDQLLSTTPDTIATFKELQELRRAQRKYPSCTGSGPQNGFELGLFTRYPVSTVKQQVSAALTRNQIAGPAGFTATSNSIDQPTRNALVALRNKFDKGDSHKLDLKFYDWISRASDRN